MTGLLKGVLLVALCLAASVASSHAQSGSKRMALMSVAPCASYGSWPFLDHMQRLGWKIGENLVFDCVSMHERLADIPAVAAEIVARRPDVIIAPSTPFVRAAKAATTSIPIVMWGTPDPVRERLVVNLARPE